MGYSNDGGVLANPHSTLTKVPNMKPLIAGVGMVPFTKAGKSDPWDQMGQAAARAALQDAHVPYEDIEVAHVGYVYADSTAAQSALYNVGLTGIPIINVNKTAPAAQRPFILPVRPLPPARRMWLWRWVSSR